MTDQETFEEFIDNLAGIVSCSCDSLSLFRQDKEEANKSSNKRLYALSFSVQTEELIKEVYDVKFFAEWQILQGKKLRYHHKFEKGTIRKGKAELEILLKKTVINYNLNLENFDLTLDFDDNFQLKVLLIDASDYYCLHAGWRSTFPNMKRQGGTGRFYQIQAAQILLSGMYII